MVSEPTAKLKVTVKLVQPTLSELPEPAMPTKAPLSVTRLAVAVVLVLAAAYGGRWLYQFWPQAGIDYSAYAAPADEAANDSLEHANQNRANQSTPPLSTKADQPFSQVNDPVVLPATQASAAVKKVASEPIASEPVAVTNVAKEHTNLRNTDAINTDGGNRSKQSLVATSVALAQQPNVDAKSTAQVQAGTPITHLPQGFRRIVFTAQMERLEPGEPVAEPVPYHAVKRVYLFTEVEGFAGQILHHRWYWNNQFQYEARLTVEDSPWRTYSEKWLLDDQQGAWRVEIIDQAQNVLYQHDFTYQ